MSACVDARLYPCQCFSLICCEEPVFRFIVLACGTLGSGGNLVCKFMQKSFSSCFANASERSGCLLLFAARRQVTVSVFARRSFSSTP